MYKYEILLYWSDEDSVFVAEVPELPGCIAHGSAPESALKNVNDAIRQWIETVKEFVGDQVPHPEGRRLMCA
ncbi:MAG: type II toxin-antitoxin system HicB family antitoxin [Candidatus Riflebacteria bacterium]|nr:type II toxin-antitoxin system HicB family antitoxin [Candidatus Riflebacteria bacterium]